MTLQPVLLRELRGASRRLMTRRMRFWAAALAVGASLIAIAKGSAGPGISTFANSLFGVQAAYAFLLALLAGVVFTSDCLSEERREGTFELLLLTDLTTHDLILGKFAATAANALCCLLAALPVLAVPLLQGGITFGEFWRMALALVNVLFFSLAAGLLLSARVTDYARALGGALALVAGVTAGLPALAAAGVALGISPDWFHFTIVSPLYPYLYAADTVYSKQAAMFWGALFASNLLSWYLLGVADVTLTRLWPRGSHWAEGNGCERRPSRSAADNIRRRKRSTASSDPIVRLSGRANALRWLAWAIVGGWAAVVGNGRLWPALPFLDIPNAKAFAFLLKTLVAFQACRFFVETRRNGALELLLCSPLRSQDLIAAQWRALTRIFLWPLIAFVLLQTVTLISPLTPNLHSPLANFNLLKLQMENGFLGVFFVTFSLLADILAVGWFGMWLALTVRRPVLAPALTILFVLVLPACLYRLDLVVDMLLISWSTTQLARDFRWVVLGPAEPILPEALGQPQPT